MNTAKAQFLIILLIGLFSVLPAQTQDWLWAVRAGGGYYESGNAITTDVNGNVYVTGSFYGTADFGDLMLESTSPDYNDIFVGKIDPNGNWLWVSRAGGNNDDFGHGIAVDAAGNVYVTGEFTVTASFGTTSLVSNGSYDIFIAKLDNNGNWLWAKSAGSGSSERGQGLTLDDEANVYVTGNFYSSVSFGTTTLTSAGSYDVFVAKLNSSGVWQWAVRAGGTGIDGGLSITCDGNGNSYITGQFRATANFGTNSITALGGSSVPDIFVAKLNSSGAWQWAIRAGSTGNDIGEAIAVDEYGYVYLAGYINGSVSFGTTILTGIGGNDIFAAKLDSSGNWLWANRAGSSGLDIAMGIDYDSSGNVYVTGYFSDTADFSAYYLTSLGSTDIFAAKLDSSGNWLWAKRAGSSSSDSGYGIAVYNSANIYFTGKFNGTADFGTTTISCGYLLDPDIYVAKIGSSATPKAPENLVISVSESDIFLDWDPVTQDTNDQPLTPDTYYIYINSGNDPYGDFIYLNQTTNTEYIHVGATPGSLARFYLIKAVKN